MTPPREREREREKHASAQDTHIQHTFRKVRVFSKKTPKRLHTYMSRVGILATAIISEAALLYAIMSAFAQWLG